MADRPIVPLVPPRETPGNATHGQAEPGLDEPTPSEIKHLAEQIRTEVVQRRNARDGRSAAEHLIAALRCLYNHAVHDGWITDN